MDKGVSSIGWSGGFLEIQGKQYCENFDTGSEEQSEKCTKKEKCTKSVQVTIVTGKYGFRKRWMSGSITLKTYFITK